MAIQVNEAESLPAITYNRIHMNSLQVQQHIDSPGVYKVTVHYQVYGDVNGVRYFKDKGEIKSLTVDDYLAIAMQKNSEGDATMLQAFGAIETAIAALLTDKANLSSSVVA